MKAPAQCSDLTDLIISRSNGGEIHQHAAEGAERLTTAKSVAVADIQNSSRNGSLAPRLAFGQTRLAVSKTA